MSFFWKSASCLVLDPFWSRKRYEEALGLLSLPQPIATLWGMRLRCRTEADSVKLSLALWCEHQWNQVSALWVQFAGGFEKCLVWYFFYIEIGIFNRCQVLNCSGALPDGAALWIRCLCSIVVMLFLGGIRIAAVVVESSWVRVTWRGRLYLFNWLSAHLLNVGNHIFKEQCNPQL